MRFSDSFLFRVTCNAVVGICLVVSGARGQRVETTVDVGGIAIRYADTVNSFGGTLSPHLFADWGNRVADISGTYSQFGSGWSTQGQASGSLFAPVGSLLGELAGFAGGSTHRDGARTGEILLNGRLHAQKKLGEFFAGVGAGRTWFGDEALGLVLGEIGASRAMIQGDATLSITPVAMGDSIRYADGQLSFAWQRRTLDVTALAGARVGDQLTSLGGTARVWGSISVTAWITPRAAVVASGGSYPIDPTQGFPGGRFASVGVRIAYPRRVQTSSDQSAEAGNSEATALSFRARKSGGIVSLEVLAPAARSVEITGDFSNWDPVMMTPASDGWWVLSRALSPGKHEINVRINGGKWVVPPGLLSMLDEFGGAVGLLVVE